MRTGIALRAREFDPDRRLRFAINPAVDADVSATVSTLLIDSTWASPVNDQRTPDAA
jgi:hypothetical protein